MKSLDKKFHHFIMLNLFSMNKIRTIHISISEKKTLFSLSKPLWPNPLTTEQGQPTRPISEMPGLKPELAQAKLSSVDTGGLTTPACRR
jgi:hypothetical protein